MTSKKTPASRHAPEEVDAYLDRLPQDQKAALTRLRLIIRRTVPECTERIGYQMPIFRYKKDLVGMAAWKNHLSLYTMSTTLPLEMKNDLEGFDVSGTTIHFDADNPLPEELIVKILEFKLRLVKKA